MVLINTSLCLEHYSRVSMLLQGCTEHSYFSCAGKPIVLELSVNESTYLSDASYTAVPQDTGKYVVYMTQMAHTCHL